MSQTLSLEELTGLLRLSPQEPETAGRTTLTAYELQRLTGRETWSTEDKARLESITKTIDIQGKLFQSYDPGTQRPSDEEIREPGAWRVAYTALFNAMLAEGTGATARVARLKWLNRLFKTVDYLDVPQSTREALLVDLRSRLQVDTQVPDVPAGEAVPVMSAATPPGAPKTIPLTVLFYEGPIARAYLATLRHAGLRPERIINLIAARDLVSKKPVGSWLPQSLRNDYAASRQRAKIHFWPRKLQRTAQNDMALLLAEVERQFGFTANVLFDAHKLHALSVYSDVVDDLLITDLKDETLRARLRALSPSALLYTGGGIVPRKLLQIEHLKFLHIHPGFLPNIRGADCILWSALLHKRLSASCFYLDSGIDTGGIISRHWLPSFQVSFPEHLDHRNCYRTVYAFLDPWVRAYVLRAVTRDHEGFERIVTRTQHIGEGTTFHFMHPDLQGAALAALG